MRRTLGVALLVLAAAVEGGAGAMDSTERETIIAAVTARVRSFEAAERARDAEQLIAHYACRFRKFWPVNSGNSGRLM
jgi:hypothetical protein